MKHGRFAGAWGFAALAAAAWTGGQAWASPPTAAAAPEAAPAAAAAVPISNAQAALQTLLSSSVGRADPSLREVAVAGAAAAPAQASPSAAPGRVVVTVARGQSLDTLLRQHLASSPLKVEVLRELVRQTNPQAFAAGTGFRLVAGARLQLPSAQEQAQHAFGKVLSASMAPGQAESEERGGASATAGARRGWVRYP